ncbi:MAG: hypothetical protein NTZ52_02360 [Chlamydiae bacterium]|nr:hypothetical protein [Chlamydiota bacterium]
MSENLCQQRAKVNWIHWSARCSGHLFYGSVLKNQARAADSIREWGSRKKELYVLRDDALDGCERVLLKSI